MGRAVVLLGAPGSGKSTVGEGLGRLGLRWRDWERELLIRWGSLEAFAANKTQALGEHHRDLLAFVDAAESSAILESTGLSDREFLDRLQHERPDTVIARLDVSQSEALRRIAARQQGRHLIDDAEANRRTWQAFQYLVVPSRCVDLVIDTDVVDALEAARTLLEVLRESSS